MVLDHEYAVLGGWNRASIGRYLALAASAISATLVYFLLLAVDVAKRYGISQNLPPSVLSLAGAATVYAVLYWFFAKFAWRYWPLTALLRVPDLRGSWHCAGESLNSAGAVIFNWQGDVTIAQTWDKIRLYMRTPQSSSSSETAALVHDEATGFSLMYSYRNEPGIGETDLAGHRGFAQFTFDPTLQRATGEYFNGHGRFTFGRIVMTRSA